MDNLSAHKTSGMEEAIEAIEAAGAAGAAGAGVWYLPCGGLALRWAYSPDDNPIEKLWSKVKAHLRRVTAGTVEALGEAVAQALATVTAEECRNYFLSDGSCGCSRKVLLAFPAKLSGRSGRERMRSTGWGSRSTCAATSRNGTSLSIGTSTRSIAQRTGPPLRGGPNASSSFTSFGHLLGGEGGRPTRRPP